jgi:hypothetical protein
LVRYSFREWNSLFACNRRNGFQQLLGARALFSATALDGNPLPVGTTFTAIDNLAATPISGTFSNLVDGAIVCVNGNNFQASYSGDDGNDFTLTVVPSVWAGKKPDYVYVSGWLVELGVLARTFTSKRK